MRTRREWQRIWYHRLAKKRHALGLCGRCGKQPCGRYKWCLKCRLPYAERLRRKHAAERLARQVAA